MRFAVAQSGGPTCAINASLLGVYEAAAALREKREAIEVFGIRHGITGLLDGLLIDLDAYLADADARELLRRTPATALGSCRYRLPDAHADDTVYKRIRTALEENQIDALFYIGGNDSMDTVSKLSAWLSGQGSPIRVIGVPKTIDNDLAGTDHTPGFGSAVKYLTTTMSEIVRDCAVYNVPSVLICEIMGRDAGWLAASSSLLHANGEEAPHLIYLPEGNFTVAQFLSDVRAALETHQSVVCAVSEGVSPPDADRFRSGEKDAYGHAYLSGIGKLLETQVRHEIGCKVRSVELNVMQRCSSHLASETDLREAAECGRHAVELAFAGKTGRMVTMLREDAAAYHITYSDMPAADAANHIRTFPQAWITPSGNGVVKEAEGYFLPLIQGEVFPCMRNGMPQHFRF